MNRNFFFVALIVLVALSSPLAARGVPKPIQFFPCQNIKNNTKPLPKNIKK